MKITQTNPHKRIETTSFQMAPTSSFKKITGDNNTSFEIVQSERVHRITGVAQASRVTTKSVGQQSRAPPFI